MFKSRHPATNPALYSLALDLCAVREARAETHVTHARTILSTLINHCLEVDQ